MAEHQISGVLAPASLPRWRSARTAPLDSATGAVRCDDDQAKRDFGHAQWDVT